MHKTECEKSDNSSEASKEERSEIDIGATGENIFNPDSSGCL